MTVKDLKKRLQHVPDDFEVRYEYDGSDTNCEVMAHSVIVSSAAKAILLTDHRNAESDQIIYGNLCPLCNEWHHINYNCKEVK